MGGGEGCIGSVKHVVVWVTLPSGKQAPSAAVPLPMQTPGQIKLIKAQYAAGTLLYM